MNPVKKYGRVICLKEIAPPNVRVTVLTERGAIEYDFDTTRSNAPLLGARLNVVFELNEIQ